MYMAKRFFDTDFFKKKFIRDLEAPYKLLWFYIMTDCNHAGIWEVDFQVAQIRLNCDLDEEKTARIFQDKIVKVDNNEKWFIPSFIEFQYGELNEKNNAHLSVIQILSKYKLLNQVPHKVLTSPSQGAMDKDKDKELDKDKVKKEKELRAREKHLFKDSQFFDFDIFKNQFITTKYANADMQYYYDAVLDWSASKGEQSFDWIAVARKFMRKDEQENKLILITNGEPDEKWIEEFEKKQKAKDDAKRK